METNVVRSGPTRSPSQPTRTPAVDIYENDAEILLQADVPGVAPGAVRLEVEQGLLRFSAESKGYTWSRSFLVPRGIATDAITAELVAGVLRIVLPKSPEVRRRVVEVKAG